MLKKLFVLVVLSLQMSACVSVNDALSLRGEGEKRFYDVSYERAWTAMITAIRNQAYTIADKNKARGEIVVSRVMYDNPADCWMVGVFMAPARQQDAEGTQLEMGITRALGGICGAALENPVTILYRSFENELEEQLESVKTSAR